MTRAICIPFHRYHPQVLDFYKVYYDVLVQTFKDYTSEFDKLYLIDSDWEFSVPDTEKAKSVGIDVEVIKSKRPGHHWIQFEDALPRLKEKYVLFLDNDVLIYKKGTIDGWFKAGEKSDIVTAYDGSGGMKELVRGKFPLLNSLSATRMGSYYFVANESVRKIMSETQMAPIYYQKGTRIEELDYETRDDDWFDSFGLLTVKLLNAGCSFSKIEDDRSSIYLDNGEIYADPETSMDLGYYHIRNGNLPVYFLNNFISQNKKDYDHLIKITPQRELLRILVWFDYFQRLLGDKHREDIDSGLRDINVNLELWEEYVKRFKKYHGLKKI